MKKKVIKEEVANTYPLASGPVDNGNKLDIEGNTKARVGVIGKKVGNVFVTITNENPIKDSIYKKEYLDMGKRGFNMINFNWTPAHQDFVDKYATPLFKEEVPLPSIQLPNFDYVQKMKDMENILEEILSDGRGLIMADKMFYVVHVSHIKSVFEKYGIVSKPKF